MSGKNALPQRQQEWMALHYDSGMAPSELARAFNAEFGTSVSNDAMQKRLARRRARAPGAVPAAVTKAEKKLERDTVISHELDDGTMEVECAEGVGINTLDGLLEAAQVDLDAWAVDRHVINKWEQAARGNDGRMVVQPLWQVKAWLKSARPFDPVALGDRIEKELRHIRARPVKLKRTTSSGRLLELALYDAHIGKLAHIEETGNTGSLDQSCDDYLATCSALLERCTPDRILYPIGNDLLNADGERNMTRGGHQQDMDGRWQRVHDRAAAVVIESIERCRHVAPVDVLLIPGNHDWHASYYLAREVAAYYRGVRDVTVDASPAPHKYYRWGECLTGLAHGRHENASELPLLMAQERPADWAETRHREWHLGHLHHSKSRQTTGTESYKSVIVRWLPALSVTDAWHHEHTYSGGRAATAFVWDRARGVESIYQRGVW